MAKKSEKKSMVDKIVDAVDHVIHPDAGKDQCPVTDEACEKECASDECKASVAEVVAPKVEKSAPAKAPKELSEGELAKKKIADKAAKKAAKEKAIESSSEKSDYASHPKFAKFKPSKEQK